MNPRCIRTVLKSMVVAGFTVLIILAGSSAQTSRPVEFDPLSAYVGTWEATNSQDDPPFLILRLSEADGELHASMSHFQIAGVRNGEIVWAPLTYAEAPIRNVKVADSALSFPWSGDPPFHGGDVHFIAEGTDIAYINFPTSEEETRKIFTDNHGLKRLSPTISLHRAGATPSDDLRAEAKDNWKGILAVRVINQAEFQYRFDHGAYADYPTLVGSGLLRSVAERRFTIVPIDLSSETDPVSGYLLHLLVSRDGSSYHLLMHPKNSAGCAFGYFSDETGLVVRKSAAECPAN